MIFDLFLILSVVLNVVLFTYSRWLIKIIKTKEEDIDSVASLVSEYVSHVDSVHEMEMFYGDPTLGSLIQHGKEIVEKIDTLDYLVLESELEKEKAEDAE